MKLAIDGDEIIWGFSYGAHSLADLKEQIDMHIGYLIDRFEATDYVIYFSCKRQDGFRRLLLPAYKAHRDNREPPPLMRLAREHIEHTYKTYSIDGVEADDLLGIAITTHDDCIAVTQDKDIRSVHGLSFNPKKDTEPVYTPPQEADRNLFMQVLAGDSADGYKGIPKVGVKKADVMLRTMEKNNISYEDGVKAAYLSHGLSKQQYYINYYCARILRKNSYSLIN